MNKGLESLNYIKENINKLEEHYGTHLKIIEEELIEAETNKRNLERLKILLSKEMLYKHVGLNTGIAMIDYINEYVGDIFNG